MRLGNRGWIMPAIGGVRVLQKDAGGNRLVNSTCQEAIDDRESSMNVQKSWMKPASPAAKMTKNVTNSRI